MAAQEVAARTCGNLLVGIANPTTVPPLIRLAGHLAAASHCRVVVTHVITVPAQTALGTMRGSAAVVHAECLLRDAVRAACQQGTEARGVVEIAREVREGLLSAVDTQAADLLLIGDSEVASDGERGKRKFSRLAHQLVATTSCNLVVARFRREAMARVLIPIAAGVNLALTGLLAHALVTRAGATVRFVHLHNPDADAGAARRDIEAALRHHGLTALGPLDVIPTYHRASAVLEQAADYDLVIVGAERRSALREAVFGNVAERIASQATTSVLLVRATTGVAP